MVPQWFKTPWDAPVARLPLMKVRKPLPAPGDCGSLVAKTLPQFNPIQGRPGRISWGFALYRVRADGR